MRRGAIAVVAMLVFLAGAGAFFLLNTPSGLRWAIGLAAGQLPGSLSVAEVAGKMVGPLTLRNVSYTDPQGLHVELQSLELDWSPRTLAQRRIVLNRVSVEGVEVTLPADREGASTRGGELPDRIPMPVAVEVQELLISNALIAAADGRQLSDIHDIQLRNLELDQARFSLADLAIEERRGRSRMSAELQPHRPFAFTLQISWAAAALPPAPASAGSARLSGDLNEVSVQISLSDPAPMSLVAHVQQPLDAMQWQARLTSTGVPIQSIQPDWPELVVAGSVDASGTGPDMRASAELTAAYQHKKYRLATRVSGAPPEWQVAELTLNVLDGPASLHAAGVITTQPDLSFALSGSWTDLAWPLEGESEWSSRRGQYEIAGTPLHFRSDLSGSLQGFEARAQVERNGSTWLVHELEVQAPDSDAKASGHGRVDIDSQGVRFDLAGQWRNLGWPLTGQPDWTSSEGRYTIGGRPQQFALRIDAMLEGFDGAVELERDGASWLLKKANIRQPDSGGHADLHGQLTVGADDLNYVLAGEWRELRWPHVGPAQWSSARGKVDAAGTRDQIEIALQGLLTMAEDGAAAHPVEITARARNLRTTPYIDAKAVIPSFASRRFGVADLTADVKIDLSDTEASNIRLSAGRLRVQDRVVTELRVAGQGTTGDHELTVEAGYAQTRLAVRLKGAYADRRWEGMLGGLEVAGFLGRSWHLEQAAPMAISVDAVHIDRACVASERIRTCAAGGWQEPRQWHAQLQLENLPSAALGEIWRPDFAWDGELNGTLEMRADARGVLSGSGVLGADQGAISWLGAHETTVVGYRNVKLEADTAARTLHLAMSGDIEPTGHFEGTVAIENILGTDGPRPLQGVVTASFSSLDWVEVLVPDVRVPTGSLELEARIDGTLENPALSARGRIGAATVELARPGVRLSEVDLQITSKDAGTAEISGRALSEEGEMRLRGSMSFPQNAAWEISAHVSGEKVEVLDLPEARIVASTELDLSISPQAARVSGNVKVDHARIEPEMSTPSISLSSDIVIVDESGVSKQEQGPPLGADIRLALGEDVVFRGYGLSAGLKGQLQILQEPGKIPLATGQIDIVDGKYQALGQKLEIDEGRLVFAGSAIDDPGLDARATRTVGDVTAGVALAGTVRNPTLKLFSTPSLPDSEILSYLLLGRPSDQASDAEGAMLLRAATSMLPRGGDGQFTDRIQSAVGLDTIALQSSGTGDAGASLVLGKYLSPRIYVSYLAGVRTTVNVFKVRYDLTKNLLLETESSDRSSSGSILYKFER